MAASTPQILRELESWGTPERAKHMSRFFKVSPGSYGEHDRFLGISTPVLRNMAKTYQMISLEDIAVLLKSEFNEARALALLILQRQYEKSNLDDRRKMVDFYIQHADFINNWNLVDVSAPHIIGDFVAKTDAKILIDFSESDNLWHRRIAVVGSFALIKENRFELTLQLAEKFLYDPEDLIHKASGWMLREIGKRDRDILCEFLDRFALQMPRIMLSYALEHFDPEERKKYRNAKMR